MASEEHMQQVERHYAALGMENPHASHYAAMRGRSSGGSSSPKERTGGLGSNKGAARYKNTSAEDRAAANADGRFGYFDEVNKRYVPAFIDAMDGGGRDTSGDMFKGGGPLSGILNDLGVKPYGSERERMFVNPNTSPIVQAVSNVPQGITDAQRTSAAMAEEARQRGLRQDRMFEGDGPYDPRFGMTQESPITMGPADYQVYAMERDKAKMDQVTSPTNIPSDPIVQSSAMNSVMQQARNLAARSGLNFDMMTQEMKNQYINAVMPLSNAVTAGP